MNDNERQFTTITNDNYERQLTGNERQLRAITTITGRCWKNCLSLFRGDSHRAVFVVGLAGVGVEGGVGEFVDLLVVHGEEDLAGLHGGGVVGLGGDGGAAAGDGDLGVGRRCSQEFGGVVGVDFEVALFGVELTENSRIGFASARLGVPLAAGAAAC